MIFNKKCKICNSPFTSDKRAIAYCSDECKKTFYDNRLKKTIKTNLEKYCVENPYQNEEIKKTISEKYKFKTYTLPSGKEIKIQGYENKFLDEYFKNGGLEDDITSQGKDIDKIWYYGTDGKKHRYFPDFYIKSKNKIIEVKSDYTYKADLEKNLLKEKACLNMGYSFEFKIYKG